MDEVRQLTEAIGKVLAGHGAPTTLGERLDALQAQLERVLAETRGVGRIPEPEREKRCGGRGGPR